jgi:hypothetical protein
VTCRTRIALGLVAALSTARASADELSFEVVRGAAPSVRVGHSATVSLSLVPRPGHRLLDGGPVLVRPSGDGVAPAQPLYRLDDAADPRADVPRFEIAFRGVRAGAATLRAECAFYICRDQRCRPVTAEAKWTIQVTP